MPESQAVRLCHNCHQEVHTWYLTKATEVAYGAETKRFRAKSWLELVREYQSAFDSFAKYKKGQGEKRDNLSTES